MSEISPFLDEAEPLLDGLPFNQRMDHLSLTALKKLHDGDLPAAEQAITRCISLLERPSQVMMIFACTQLSIAILEFKTQDPNKDIRRWWKKANNFLKSYSVIFPIGVPTYLYQCGLYEESIGNTVKAADFWRQAVQASIDIQMPYILVNSINKLKNQDPDILRKYQREYEVALAIMDTQEIADDIKAA